MVQALTAPYLVGGKVSKDRYALLLPNGQGKLYSIAEISEEILDNPDGALKSGKISEVAIIKPKKRILPDGSEQFTAEFSPIGTLSDPRLLESATKSFNAVVKANGLAYLKPFLTPNQLEDVAIGTIMSTSAVTGHTVESARLIAKATIEHDARSKAFDALKDMGFKMNERVLKASSPIKVSEDLLEKEESQTPSLPDTTTVDVDPIA